MKTIKRVTAHPISSRRELIRRIRHLSDDKIEILLNTAKTFETESLKSIAELEHDIKTGDYKKWTATEYAAWDKDFVKLTPDEEIELEEAERQIAKGDVISLDQLCREEGL